MSDNWQGFKKPNFGAPPAGYIAGLGRGATGFITRSDIGPAKLEASMQKQADDGDYADSKYDSWSGYSAPLFNKKNMDDEDRQAEELYNLIEDRMDGRRRQQRQQLIKQTLKKQAQKKSISETFSDLKRQMAKVSYDDWLNLPQSVDSSLKKKKKDKYVPVPDSIVMNFMNQGQTNNKQVVTDNINDLKQAKEILLKSKLDKAANDINNVSKNAVDRTGYLTSLNSLKMNGQQYMGDLKRARLVLKSATNTTPQNPDVWMCAARVEQLDGKLQDARNIINKGLQHCKTSQDLWIQASRLQKPELSKNVLIKGLSFLPKSQKLWLTSARKQHQKQLKSKILKKGLQNNSTSLLLWRQLIELQDATQAKQLLKKAVECLPKQIDLWLALAKLQTYQGAKSVLNKARKSNPLQIKIWIAAAELEQTQTQNSQSIFSKIQNILVKSNQVLTKNGIIVSRDLWLQEAILCQKKGNKTTCQAIVKLTFTLSSQPQQQNVIYKKCLQFYERSDCIQTTRFLYRYGINILNSKMLMQKAIAFQRLVGSQKELQGILKLAIKLFGTAQQFWIATADNFISDLKFEEAIHILNQGLKIISDSQTIQLKKVDTYIEKGDITNAQSLLQQLRKSERILTWMKSIQFYYRLKNYKKSWELCEKAYKIETSENIIELAFKIQKKLNGYNNARAIIQKAVQKYEKSVNLWIQFVDLQIQNGYIAKARTALEKARVKLPKCVQLHVKSVQLQLKANNNKVALFVLSKGLAQCSNSPELWTMAIQMQPRSTRLKKIAEAQNACPDTPQIFVAGAKIFWKQNKIQKAKKWLQKALIINTLNGDTWAYFYSFINIFQPHNKQSVLQKFKATTIVDGVKWKAILKEDDSYKLSKQQILFQLAKSVQIQMTKIQ